LMAVGRNFLEVVAPTRAGTAGGRYLERRQGDGGYMVITQADSRESQALIRQNALDNGVRIAHETIRGDWNLCQLHPGDLKAAFFEVESDGYNDFHGHWMPVGGLGWEDKIKQDVTSDFIGVELQGDDPEALALLWSRVAGLPLVEEGGEPCIKLNNARLRFVSINDDRGPGLGGLDISVQNRDHILEKAKMRGCYVSDDQVNICGTRFYLHTKNHTD